MSWSTEEEAGHIGQLRIQVHPARAPFLALTGLKEECSRLAAANAAIESFFHEDGEDEGPYLDLVFETQNPLRSWPLLKRALYGSPRFGLGLRQSSTASCTGLDGWNDPLQLYHYDPTVHLDAAGKH